MGPVQHGSLLLLVNPLVPQPVDLSPAPRGTEGLSRSSLGMYAAAVPRKECPCLGRGCRGRPLEGWLSRESSAAAVRPNQSAWWQESVAMGRWSVWVGVTTTWRGSWIGDLWDRPSGRRWSASWEAGRKWPTQELRGQRWGPWEYFSVFMSDLI